MTKVTETERQHARERLVNLLGENPDDAPTIYTLTHFGSGQTDYVRCFIVDDCGAITEITWYVARAAGIRQTDRGMAFGGGNYSKALEAADAAWQAAFRRPLDQHRWQTL